MGRVSFESERIDHQQVQAQKPVTGFIGNLVAVGDVSKIAYAKRGNRQPSMNDSQGLDVEAEQGEVSFDAVRDDSRQPRVRRRLEDIVVNPAQSQPGYFGRKACKRPVPEHQRSRIIQTKTVICMSVSEEDAVQLVDARAQCLLSEIGGSIYQESVVAVLNEHRGSQSLVSRIFGEAGLAVAAYG